MPEGDTLYRLAAKLQPTIAGATLRYARSREQGELSAPVGESIERVRALGKNLFIELTGGWSFHIHLGIGGRCQCFRRRPEPGRLSATTTLVLGTDEHEVVCSRTSKARLLRTAHLPAHARMGSLGPDLLADELTEADLLDKLLRRARAPGNASRTIGELLLDQRVAAGIGNVYKNEVLFMRRLDPWARVDSLGETALSETYALARELMLANLHTGRRMTVTAEAKRKRDPRERGPARFWVYKRTGLGCLMCDDTIRSRRQGDHARTTYFCPGCQQN